MSTPDRSRIVHRDLNGSTKLVTSYIYVCKIYASVLRVSKILDDRMWRKEEMCYFYVNYRIENIAINVSCVILNILNIFKNTLLWNNVDSSCFRLVLNVYNYLTDLFRYCSVILEASHCNIIFLTIHLKRDKF